MIRPVSLGRQPVGPGKYSRQELHAWGAKLPGPPVGRPAGGVACLLRVQFCTSQFLATTSSYYCGGYVMRTTRNSLTILFATAVAVNAGCSDSEDRSMLSNSAQINDNNQLTAAEVSDRSQVPPAEQRAPGAGGVAARTAMPDNGNELSLEDILPAEFRDPAATRPAHMSVAPVQATEGNSVSGLVAFIQENAEDDHVRVVGRIMDIAEGKHGFHIHETGDCTDPVAGTAGSHFNPGNSSHGAPDSPARHVGDLGNLEATADRTAQLDFEDEHLSLTGMNSIVGKAFIIHRGEDDLSTQPSGDSGPPIACGVIGNNEYALVPQ